jgi:hypothetical protein
MLIYNNSEAHLMHMLMRGMVPEPHRIDRRILS